MPMPVMRMDTTTMRITIMATMIIMATTMIMPHMATVTITITTTSIAITPIITTATSMLMTTNEPVAARGLAEREAAALYRLMTWLSPAFPVRGFSYSSGLEWGGGAGDINHRGPRPRGARGGGAVPVDDVAVTRVSRRGLFLLQRHRMGGRGRRHHRHRVA